MNRIDDKPTTFSPPDNAVPIGTIRATLDRQIAELRALATSPGERAILARMATQAITRGLSDAVAS